MKDRMHVLNRLEGRPEENDPSNNQDKPEAGGSTDVNAFGRLYCTILLCHGHVVSLSILIKKGAFKKTCNGLSNKPLMQKVHLLLKPFFLHNTKQKYIWISLLFYGTQLCCY